MEEKNKNIVDGNIEVNRVGRGEVVKYHTYRIFRSGRLEDCFGNAVEPIIKNGRAYIEIPGGTKLNPVLVEVARVLYSTLVQEIELLGNSPQIIYKDDDGTNFRLDNLDIDKSETKKYIDVEEILDSEEDINEIKETAGNPVEELREQVSSIEELFGINKIKESSGEEMLTELNNLANSALDTDFATSINKKISDLKEKISSLESMRNLDKEAFAKQLGALNAEIERLNSIILQKTTENQNLFNQNKQLLEEKANRDENMVMLTKESFYGMYETMKKVLVMIDSIER